MRERERHRQRDRNRNRHQQRRPPLPEPNQRNDHHQRDRFVQRIHEKVHVLAHLSGLVGRLGDNQVRRQQGFGRRQLSPLHCSRNSRSARPAASASTRSPRACVAISPSRRARRSNSSTVRGFGTRCEYPPNPASRSRAELEVPTITLPMSAGVSNSPEGSIRIFLVPASSVPPGRVMFREFRMLFRLDGCRPYDASRSCE